MRLFFPSPFFAISKRNSIFSLACLHTFFCSTDRARLWCQRWFVIFHMSDLFAEEEGEKKGCLAKAPTFPHTKRENKWKRVAFLISLSGENGVCEHTLRAAKSNYKFHHLGRLEFKAGKKASAQGNQNCAMKKRRGNKVGVVHFQSWIQEVISPNLATAPFSAVRRAGRFNQ